MADGERRAHDLIELALATPWFRRALTAVGRLGLESWAVGAGAVRNLVWDHLHGYATPSHLADLDVAYFDPQDLTAESEARLRATLVADCPDLPWEVTNQASVHLWYAQAFGYAVPALTSLEAAIATWPETATSVAITIEPDGTPRIIAPCGLEDLFAMIVRRNPTRVSLEWYRQRIATKRYAERWPRVTIVP